MTDEELIKDIVRDKKIMYASREAGIKCFAETYAFNIESVLFNQLTLEQQELWRKEIENAAISGGEMGLELAYDKRYDKELSKNLEEEIEKIDDQYPVEIQYIREIARHFAEWQKEKDYKMYAHVPLKDIHDAWQELKKNKPDIENYPAVCFQKGADWRENHMKETLQTEYEKGRYDMQQEMIKDAVEGEVVYKIGNAEIAPTDVRYKVMSDRVYIPNVKLGDKVKIIICKTEQQ